MDDETIRSVVTRLARPHPSGGDVIERSAVVAEGAESAAILRWIVDHDGEPEDPVRSTSGHGVHERQRSRGPDSRKPLRYVFPPGTLR